MHQHRYIVGLKMMVLLQEETIKKHPSEEDKLISDFILHSPPPIS